MRDVADQGGWATGWATLKSLVYILVAYVAYVAYIVESSREACIYTYTLYDL